ncbi:CoA ester lyase [Ramlibacter sp.]|uniref:HpcH/HpaI aldolase/citrate lyase family protein n=1 Tax=Ramlibacter sp. TaxID=1917967 RepID=UPI002D4E4466|nr:CoA ester lyase [Ramlibacter sp.]HYD76243.1 CoA ester lyase [Ramlibacter sp.]
MSEKSFLFVPGNRPERFDKACAAGADAVILDLEDAVAPAGKDAAREAVRGWLAQGGRAWLRLNGTDTPWHAADLALLELPGVAGVLLPKAERAQELQSLVQRMRPGTPLVPLVETAVGLWNARELASVPGVQRLAFGSVDFQLDLSIQGDGEELLYARSQLVLASRVAGVLPPVDGVTVAIDDESVLRADVERARRLGFGGKLCIHPKQVAAIQAGFRPPAAELEWARRVMEAAESAGHDAVRVDGKLVDKPIIDRARAMLQEEKAG